MSRLDIEKVDGVAIARVNEDIDAANATAIQHELAEALGPDALCLVVDLGGIRYLDSAGIDMLLRLSDLLRHRRAKLILVIPDSSQLKRLVTIVGLPGAITIRPSLRDALKQASDPCPGARLGARGRLPPLHAAGLVDRTSRPEHPIFTHFKVGEYRMGDLVAVPIADRGCVIVICPG